MSAHGIEDLALMCSLPGFTVVVPCDAAETTQAIRAVANMGGPCYVRLSRPAIPVVCDDNYQFQLGKAATFRQGSDVSILATGIMVEKALEAAVHLANEGIECRVVNVSTIKPIDEENGHPMCRGDGGHRHCRGAPGAWGAGERYISITEPETSHAYVDGGYR